MGILSRFRRKAKERREERPPPAAEPRASVLNSPPNGLGAGLGDNSGRDAPPPSDERAGSPGGVTPRELSRAARPPSSAGQGGQSAQPPSSASQLAQPRATQPARPSPLGEARKGSTLNPGADPNIKTTPLSGDDVLRLKKKVNNGDAPVRITIMNGKGGSGKSTLTTNLATVLSTHANSVTIIDNDPQASSIRWLKERPHTAIPIRGVTASEMTRLKNIQLWNSGIGPETRFVIIDTQAGLKGIELSDVIDRSDMIIIPVLPSAIDMRATADFVAQVFLSKAYRRTRKPIGVVANRVINDSIIYRKLQKFLLSLRMNFISTFSDNRAYLIAAERGLGIFETNEANTEGEKTEWNLLNQWVEDKRKAVLSASGK